MEELLGGWGISQPILMCVNGDCVKLVTDELSRASFGTEKMTTHCSTKSLGDQPFWVLDVGDIAPPETMAVEEDSQPNVSNISVPADREFFLEAGDGALCMIQHGTRIGLSFTKMLELLSNKNWW